MLRPSWFSRRTAPEPTAAKAWEYLTTAMTGAGDNTRAARKRGARLANEAGDRLESAADEAWERAHAAMNALAGRRPGLPWRWIIGVGLAGVAAGWAIAAAARGAMTRPTDTAEEAAAGDEPAAPPAAPPPLDG